MRASYPDQLDIYIYLFKTYEFFETFNKFKQLRESRVCAVANGDLNSAHTRQVYIYISCHVQSIQIVDFFKNETRHVHTQIRVKNWYILANLKLRDCLGWRQMEIQRSVSDPAPSNSGQ